MRNLKYAFAALALLCLSACATFDQRLNTATQIHAATTRSVTSALDARLISSMEAEAYQGIAVNSSVILDAARALKDSDPSTAEGKLKLVDGILTEMRNYLLSLEAK